MVKHNIANNPLFRRAGRRGTLLVISGLAWIGVGVSIWYTPTLNRFSMPGPDPSVYLHLMDQSWTAFVWALCGTAALVIGLIGKRAPVDPRESIGFNFILTPPLLWTLVYTWSLVTYLLTDGTQGRLSSAVAIIIFLLVSLFILVVAGWPEVSTDGLVSAPLPPEVEES